MARIAAFVLGLASVALAQEPAKVEVTAVDRAGVPLVDLTIVVAAAGGNTQVARTDARGEARFQVPAGSIAILATFGTRSSKQTLEVAPGETANVTVRLDVDGAHEEIVIVERTKSLAAPPQVDRASVLRELPYSDEAIAQNVWASVWVLLDISDKGEVVAARVLTGPKDLGLEAIALEVARKLRFRPELDRDGRPVASQILWLIEWEPYWTRRHEPTARNGFRCTGSGPLNLDYLNGSWGMGYRNCAPPKGYEHVQMIHTLGKRGPRFKPRR